MFTIRHTVRRLTNLNKNKQFVRLLSEQASKKAGETSVETKFQNSKFHRRYRGKGVRWGVVGLLGFGIALKTFRKVPAGHVGVVDVFGKVEDETLLPGLHMVKPWASVKKFTLKTEKLTFDCSVPSSEGLAVRLVVTLQIRTLPEKTVNLYKTVGLNYRDILIDPVVNSAIREIACKRSSKELYSQEGRAGINKELLSFLKERLEKRGIVIQDALLAKIDLPRNLTQAIERKLEMEQESQRMNFVLEKEKLEAERKKIEAQGIQDFQQIVRKGIDENLLKWKGIEATEKLAESPNAKVVVVGGGKDGLPIILGK